MPKLKDLKDLASTVLPAGAVHFAKACTAKELKNLVAMHMALTGALTPGQTSVPGAIPPVTIPPTAPVRASDVFGVWLERTGNNKIGVIKAIRNATTMGLREAKDVADAAELTTKFVANCGTLEAAKALVQRFQDVGAHAFYRVVAE